MSVKYPVRLGRYFDEIEHIVSGWPRSASIDEVMNWALQFDNDDCELAVRVLRNLNVVGYEDLNRALRVAYSKLMRRAIERDARITAKNTLFAGVGSAGKSGSMMEYHFRLINDAISEENFLGDDTVRHIEAGRIENIVLVDDIVSTGQQATKEIRELTARVTPLGVKNIFLLTACGFSEGIEHVEAETKAYTFSAFEYNQADTAASLDSRFYSGVPYDERQRMKELLTRYGTVCAPKYAFGYGGLGALMVFHYNTPNSTLPIVWADMNGWLPLFRRVRRVSGVSSYFKQFDRAVTNEARKSPQEQPAASPAAELTFFVEGKIDEMFFDAVIRDCGLAERLQVGRIEVVSLGGGFNSSERLLKTLNVLRQPAVFIFDGDTVSHSGSTLGKMLPKIRHVVLQTSVAELLDLKKMIESDEMAELLVNVPEIVAAEGAELIPHVEWHLFRRMPRSRLERQFRQLIPAFVDPDKLESFIARVRAELTRSLPTDPVAHP